MMEPHAVGARFPQPTPPRARLGPGQGAEWVEGWLSPSEKPSPLPRCDLAHAQPSFCLICGMELQSSPGALWTAECCWHVCGKSS